MRTSGTDVWNFGTDVRTSGGDMWTIGIDVNITIGVLEEWEVPFWTLLVPQGRGGS